MGRLTEGARKSFNRYGRSQNVPAWYKFSYFIGFFIISVALLISFLQNDTTEVNSISKDSNTFLNTKPIDKTPDETGTEIDILENDLENEHKIKDLDGAIYSIPLESYQVAKLAALAFFTGDWDSVPTYGDKPNSSSSDKNIKITNATLLSSDDSTVSILFTYTRDGKEKEFNIQIIVYYINNKWVFSE
jgi:hypothetical protein